MQQNLINILNIDFNVILQTLFDDLLFDEMGNCFRKSKHKISVTEEIAFFNKLKPNVSILTQKKMYKY